MTKRLPSWLEEVLMALGAVLWLSGETYAAYKGEDTTTSYVRRGKRIKFWGIIVLVACIIGTSWLWGHFVLDIWG